MTDTISERLRGIYRIPITDGLGPAGGLEPDNPDEFVRDFSAFTPPIQIEAADHIDAQDATIKALVDALERVASRHVTESPLWWQVEARTAIDAASPANKSP